MRTLISMLIGSKFSTKELVEKSIQSILLNIGTTDFLLVVGIASHIDQQVVNSIPINANVKVERLYCSSFAEFTNHVFSKYGAGTKWFIVSHDDIQLETPNLVSAVESSTSSFLDKIGWISFTDTDYLNGHWAPCTRPGYHSDFLYESAWEKRKLHQFHSLEDNYWEKGSEYQACDYPRSAVKCHAPFSHFIMIEAEKLRRIGLCENWSEVSLLIDEDWGLSALKQGLFNIWIPHIKYRHCRIQNGTRAQPIINSKGKQVIASFAKKWGFHPKLPNRETETKIKQLYGNTNIIWSFDKKSFDWEYLK